MASAVEPPRWPPRSPFEALLSSPSGRQRVQSRCRDGSPSPSPFKESKQAPDVSSIQRKLEYADRDIEDEEEDEETLQLRLEALEAKLKLKRLQARKAKHANDESEVPNPKDYDRPPTRASSVLSSRREQVQAHRVMSTSKSIDNLQVPLSPEKRRIVTQEPRSPGRVLLGIDKGLRGSNVSLRRAPSLRARAVADEDPFGSIIPKKLTSSATLIRPPVEPISSGQSAQKSFSQRIAETRQQDKDLQDRKNRLDQLRANRSTGFGIQREQLEALKAASKAEPEGNKTLQNSNDRENGFSRDQVIQAFNKAPGGLVTRSETASGVRNSRRVVSSSISKAKAPTSILKTSASQPTLSQKRYERQLAPPSPVAEKLFEPTMSSEDSSLFEPYSLTNLSRRILPHSFLERTLDGKTPVVIPSLLRDIKAPDFSLPPSLEESDIVMIATIASKSSPLNHKDAHISRTTDSSTSSTAQAAESESNIRGKYMVFTLTDLKWTLDLYLFTTAYTRFWKLQPGTVIAILNPNIMPPPRGKEDTGRWSLSLNSSDDTILEIGTARDLGFCKAVRKDGRRCDGWVDLRKTEFCEWHVDCGVEKMRRGRMEVQGMSAPFAPGGRSSARSGMFGGRRKGPAGHREDELLKEGRQYDRDTRSTYFVAPTFSGGSVASLLDADDNVFGRGAGKEEALRKRLAEREKERNIAKQLGMAGNGTGAEYLRIRHGDGSIDDGDRRADGRPPVDAGALGLLDNSAGNVQLSPLKRRRSARDMSVARKKTRFVTAKGIREAGRESFGVVAGAGSEDGVVSQGVNSADEDDLVIV
ncbi:hypothetical protein MMC19_004234 [Ptychographa xylographoides]|nr:hypothetical protein [Ptychographa xylographoides]